MKIVVKKGIIESAAEVLSKVIDPKNVLPIMSNILCEVEGMEMKMRAGNGVFTLSTTIPLEEAVAILKETMFLARHGISLPKASRPALNLRFGAG